MEKNKIKINDKEYHWFSSLHEESKEGWIWFPLNFSNSKNHVVIRQQNKCKFWVCEIRIIDKNFCYIYNDRKIKKSNSNLPKLYESNNSIVINDYYRKRLGINSTEIYNFKVTTTNCLFFKIIALIQHPSPTVRISFWLATTSIILSIIGIVFSIISLVN